jgi:hypothetical protein
MKILKWLLIALTAGTLANALWMLVAPFQWYRLLPAGVPDFGAYNPHFVRDLGCAFFTVGVMLVEAVRTPARTRLLAGFALVFYGAHALVHVFDTLSGHVAMHHFLTDLPLTYIPVAILGITVFSRSDTAQ